MYIVLDLETTGLSPKNDTIIECAFVKIDRKTFEEIDRFTTFVNPRRDIPELISNITNIFDKDVEFSPIFSDISWDIEEFIEWYPLIGHNISFDISFLESHGVDTSKNPYIDTFFLANILCYKEKSLNLWHLCEVFSIKLDSAHRAIDDTVATARLFACLISLLQKTTQKEKNFIASLLHTSRDAWLRVIESEYLSEEKIYTKREDIFTNYISEITKNPWVQVDKIHMNSWVKIDDFFSQNESFESRNSQKIMLDKVDNNFNTAGKCIIEAPTGTWKTFAYLLPAIKYSLHTWEAVHISTSTKALQDQIFYKDLAYISDTLACPFSYTKLKGKRNYFSLQSFETFFETCDFDNASQLCFVLKVLLWSLQSTYGELDELDFYGEEFRFLSDIHAGIPSVLSEENIYRQYEFVYKARQKALSSNIIITNNHILFADVMWQWSLLWGVKNLVLDEAHSLEDIITSSLSQSLTYKRLEDISAKIQKKATKYEIDINDILSALQRILFELHEVYGSLESLLFTKFSANTKYKNLLLGEDFFEENSHLTHIITRVLDDFSFISQAISQLPWKKSQVLSAEYQDILSVSELLSTTFIKRDLSRYIYYISHSEHRGLELTFTVLKPWEFLEKYIWRELESVLLTSATLQMGDDFSYIKNSLHLYDFETLLLESDFDYSKQALLYIPNDLGSVKYNLEQITQFLEKLFLKIGWQALMLFTSYANIKSVYSTLNMVLKNSGITLLAQAISGGKHKQIEYFKKHSKSSILLGTDTFWEWIDIPGDDLRYLLIHKIPFQVPTDPIFKARSALYKDDFSEYSIPKAVLKLKQWFWRLIRSKNDTGVVVFLDDRIFSTRWWERILESFPHDIKIRYGSTENLINILK